MRHRPLIVLLSAVADLIVIGAIVVASGLAPGGLPVPHQLLAAPVERVVQLPDIPLPPQPRTPVPPAPVTPQNDRAPVTPPDSLPPVSEPTPTGADPGIDVGQGPGNGTIEPVTEQVIGPGLPVAPPPAATANAPTRLHSGIDAPRKLRDVVPVYPSAARALRVQGLVILEVTIDERGSVTNARVLRSLPGLDQAALDAVTQWTFAPARLNGEAIPVVMTVTVNFRLTP